jgi:PAS domain-containing protein
VFCGLVLTGALAWHNRLLTRANRKVQRTTEHLQRTARDLEAANAAVARANTELREQNRLLVEKENALTAQNALFDAALNNMSQGLCMFDRDMQPIVFNTQFERMFHVRSLAENGTPQGDQPLSLRELAPDLAGEI